MELLSPVASRAKNGVFKIDPNFSFESANSDTLPTEDQAGEAQPGIDGRLAKLEGQPLFPRVFYVIRTH